jgi:hypothetical protein
MGAATAAGNPATSVSRTSEAVCPVVKNSIPAVVTTLILMEIAGSFPLIEHHETSPG